MVPDVRTQRHIRGYALILIFLSMLTLLPARPTSAEMATEPVQLDNTQGEFAGGVFQRSAIGPERLSDITPGLTPGTDEFVDLPGVVQLAPAGILKPWNALAPSLPSGPSPIDAAVTNAGVTAIGTRIYVVGGIQKGASGYTDDVYWADVDPQTGTLIGDTWNHRDLDDLPATPLMLDNDLSVVDANPECKALSIGARARAGVAGLATGTNTGYLYVVGGRFTSSSCPGELTTAVVQRGTVATDGTISWTTLTDTPLPGPKVHNDDGTTPAPNRYLGVDGAATVIASYRDSGGIDHYYLYVIGGETHYVNGSASTFDRYSLSQRVMRSVYYTEIDFASGNLKNPDTGLLTSVWKRDSDIQLHDAPLDKEGLWDATATATSVTVGTQVKSAIFLSGGAHNIGLTSLDAYVYRADIGANGALNWGGTDRTKTVGNDEVGMTARLGMGSIAYNNKLYMIGGRTNGTPGSGLNSVPTAFFDDNLNLIKIDGTNFIIGASEKVLNIDNDEGRYNMGVALVRAEPPDTVQGTLNSAWVFVIGGSDINGNETNTMYQGKIGGDDATADSYTPDGWYYSNIFQTSYAFGSGQWIEYEKARLVSFHWASSINRGSNTNADIQVYFRTKSTLTSLCTGDNIFTSSDPWIGPLDGYGGNPLYSTVPANGALYNNATLLGNYTDAQLTGNCVQYRAQILRGGSLLSVTPKLLSVSIKKEIAGNADLNIPTDGFSVTTGADNQISTMVMRVQNLSTLGLSQTISVPRAREANGLTADGSVYVNLCIARSDLDQPPPTLTLPNPNTFGSSADINLCRYYAHIYSYQLLKGTVIDLLGTNPNNGNNSYWFDNLNGYAPVPDIKSVFKQSGHYRIGLILDTANYGIPEGTPGEANNQSSMITFTIISPYTIFMPLILH